MSTAKRLHYGYDEYRRLLERSDIKLEFHDGVIYAMAGGTVAHGQLSLAVGSLLRQALLGRCSAFFSDVMVRVESSNLSTYPDVSVVCGEVQRSKLDANAVTNPTVVVEVTSRSTEEYDRGDKLSHYQLLPALRAVLLVSHRTRAITVVERSATGWDEREVLAGETVTLREPSVSLRVDDVYAGVELEAA